MTTRPAVPTAVSSQSVASPPLGSESFAGFDLALTEAAAVRHDQLRRLPDADGDPVVAAQRAALLQTLSDLVAAQERLATGTFGRCERCREDIPSARLELRPWATTCVACGSF